MQTISDQLLDTLSRTPLGADLPFATLQTMGKYARLRTVATEQTLFASEQAAQHLYILIQGAVKLYRLSPEGKIVITGMLQPGALFGERALVEGDYYGNNAETLTDATICLINGEAAREILLRDAVFAQRVVQMMGNRLGELEYQLSVVALKPLIERVVALLLVLDRSLRRFGNRIDQPEISITHEELAHMVGANRESVTKVLSELQMQGILTLHRGCITLLRPDLIRTSCAGNPI